MSVFILYFISLFTYSIYVSYRPEIKYIYLLFIHILIFIDYLFILFYYIQNIIIHILPALQVDCVSNKEINRIIKWQICKISFSVSTLQFNENYKFHKFYEIWYLELNRIGK